MTETLRQKQSRFARAVANLIIAAEKKGYEVTLGDAYRNPEYAEEVKKKSGGLGAKSLHCQRLAIDLMLFRDGKYLRTTDDYKELGLWWESQGAEYSWGGRFSDGNHFSFAHGSRR